ncbi:MAG: phosphate acyltransferase [Clostridiales bacterium]
MEFMDIMIEKARKNPKKIVFPEANEKMILKVARYLQDKGIILPVLIGNPEEIKDLSQRENININNMEVLNNDDSKFKERIVKEFLTINDIFSEKALNRKFKNPLNFASAVVKLGMGDCLAAGLNYTTAEVILSAQSFIGMGEGIDIVSSIGIVEFPYYKGSEDNMLVFGDCAVNPSPDSKGLADIVISSAETVKRVLGWEPHVAMLSFSTKGSGEHESIDKILKAVDIVKEKRPELKIDGELQLDAAIIPRIAEKKLKMESEVAGRANILIFPDLGAGNIGVKIAQIFAKATAHGPLLQGFSKPVTDFSRSAPFEEIVGNLIMLVNSANKEVV